MSSWGASTSDESKPKYLTDVEKRDCFANNTGWTVPAGGNDKSLCPTCITSCIENHVLSWSNQSFQSSNVINLLDVSMFGSSS